MRIFNAILSLLAMVTIVTGCEVFDDRPPETDATVNFRLVDAPAPYEEVWVEVEAIRIKADYEGSEMDDNDDSWEEIVLEGSTMVNLLDLTGGNSLLLGTQTFPAGEIDQIRLILGDNNYLVSEGEQIALKTPSAQQSGLKIKVNQEIQAGHTYDLVVDFDVAKSIVTAGNSGNVILKPVLRAFLDQTQGIQGQVFPLEAHPVQVTVFAPGFEINTFADQEGNYSIMGLVPGSYSVKFTPQRPYLSETMSGITVTENEVTTREVFTLEARP